MHNPIEISLFDGETIMRNHDARMLREGIAKGENRLAALMSRLISAGRIKEAARASSDPEYREKLYAELGII